MLISTSQINAAQLTAFVTTASSGAALSGSLQAYFNGSGTSGPNVVYTYSDQLITGRKTFLLAPNVPYVDGTGRAPSALYVQTQDLAVSGVLGGYLNSLSGFVIGASGALSIIRVTGSNPISSANLTGLGGTLVIYSGGQIFISGAAAGGGGGNLSVTGSAAISAPNLTGAGFVSVYYDGTYVTFSGSAPAIDTSSLVTTTGNEIIGGFKQFTGSPWVPYPTLPSGVTNLFAVTGASGALSARDIAISGVLQAGINAASSTTVITGTQVYNLSGITGNFVNMSFYFDEFSLATGLNQVESFIGRDFTCTGYAIGTIMTGTQGSFSGSFYQRNTLSVKTSFVSFGMPPGQFFSGRGGLVQTVSGMNRVGLDIYLIGTGLTGLSVGLFGVGY